VAQPGWESPSVNPLKGIPLPPSMPPLPPADAPLLSDDFGMGKGFGTDKGGGGGSAGGSAGGGGSDDGFDEADGDTKVGAGGLSKEQKLTQRMQRKAESARVARLRKKEYVSGLEAEVASLRAELTQLREKGASADTPTLKEEGQRHRASMEALLKQSVLDTPEVNATEVTVEKYVANKRAQQETINEYLDSIEDILSPGMPLQVAFSASSAEADGDGAAAGEGAAAESSDGDGGPNPKRQRQNSIGSQLLETLSTELGLTAAQVDELSGQKGFIHSDREIKAQCTALIKELRVRVSEHIKTSQTITDCLRRILTPLQVAKFLVWVERNQRSMDLLNTMFQSDDAA